MIKEGYLEGNITYFMGGTTDINIDRMTERGTLLLDTTENPEFLEWVKTNTGSAFGELMKDGVKGGATFGWSLAKQWLAEKFGLTL